VHTWKRVLAAALFALPLIGFANAGLAQEAAAEAATVTEAVVEAPGISPEGLHHQQHLDDGFHLPGVYHASGLRHGRVGLVSGEKHGEHPV
jgi:hypothetical protein